MEFRYLLFSNFLHTVTFLILVQSKNVIRIIRRYLWELSESSIEILDFFIKFISKTQKMLLFWQFFLDVAGWQTCPYFFGSDKV